MRVLESRIEPAGPGLMKVITLIEVSDDRSSGDDVDPNLGAGPIGDAIPDHIVKALIDNLPSQSMTVAEIHTVVGGNPSTVNRQAWTLAANAPDLQHRLRGWVTSPERGRYALTASARQQIARGE